MHDVTAHELNRRLGKGINLGNALDTPSEGAFGFRLTEAHFDAVRTAGFDTVRLPVRWSGHAAERAPYTINDRFLDRVAWAVDCAIDRSLNIVLDVHHYDELHTNPDGHTDRFLSLWEQIAARYAACTDKLYLELLNEAHAAPDATTVECPARRSPRDRPRRQP